MNIEGYIDHTLLKFNATDDAFYQLANEAILFGFASVCVPPSAVRYLRRQFPELRICSVVGFPCGYQTTKTKIAEVTELSAEGVNELDFVINLQQFHSGNYELVENELYSLIGKCRENHILSKIIVESGSLSEIQLSTVCAIINKCLPDYIKTSTGMLLNGYAVTPEEISRIRLLTESEIKIKASGGIRTRLQALELIQAGADRIGTSSSINIIQTMEN